MNMKLISVVAFAAVFIASSAQGATIMNNEATPQSIKIISADKEKTFTVSPSDMISLDELCPEKCVLVLQDGSDFEFASGEELMLEDGTVFVNPPAQGDGVTERPTQQ
jgi:hypothetical protein